MVHIVIALGEAGALSLSNHRVKVKDSTKLTLGVYFSELTLLSLAKPIDVNLEHRG